MNPGQEVIYALSSRHVPKEAVLSHAIAPISRIARLMALAIRLEGLIRDETVQNYAELAHLGGVTRARMTQITKLLQLAPDLQEQILFLPPLKGLNERNLRALVQQLDWSKQRPIFEKMIVTRTEDGSASI
jgi:hypothetical protein